MIDDHKLITSKEAAQYLGVCPSTLTKWRIKNRYNLPFIRIGKMCKYRLNDLAEFLSRHTHGFEAERKSLKIMENN